MSWKRHFSGADSIVSRVKEDPYLYLPELSASILGHFLQGYFSRLHENNLEDPANGLLLKFTEWVQAKYEVDKSYHNDVLIIESYARGNEDSFLLFFRDLEEYSAQLNILYPDQISASPVVQSLKKKTFKELLEAIKEKPAMYLGVATFRGLAAFILGYLQAGTDCALPKDPGEVEFTYFRDWVEKEKNKGRARSWYKLIIYMSTTDCGHVSNGAFNKFFSWYDEFCAIRASES